MDASGGAPEPALVRWSVSLSLALPFKTITSAAARGGRARERERKMTRWQELAFYESDYLAALQMFQSSFCLNASFNAVKTKE